MDWSCPESMALWDPRAWSAGEWSSAARSLIEVLANAAMVRRSRLRMLSMRPTWPTSCRLSLWVRLTYYRDRRTKRLPAARW